jgi:Helicase HerA, central domain
MNIFGTGFATTFPNFNIVFFKKRERVGDVVSRLGMSRIYFDRPRWQWKRVRPKRIEIASAKRLNPHIAIVGESGSGKSNACKAIVKEIASRGINVAILDPHSEYIGVADSINASVYDAVHSGINIFDLDGVSEREKANELTGMFRRVFRLGDVQGYQLYRAILFTYTRVGAYGRVPGMHDLMYTLEIFKKHASPGEQRAIEGISRRLSLIDTGAFSRSTPMDKVMSGNSIFILSGLHTNEAQSVYVEGFLRKIYSKMLASEKKGSARLYIVIDEAEKLGQKSVIGKIAAEGRKYGIGLIVMAQRSKSMDKEIRANASLFISFYHREPEELNYIANLIAGGNELNRFMEVKKAIRNLRTGNAIVVDSAERNPFIVRFGLCADNGTSLAYEIMKLARSSSTRGEILEKVSQAGFPHGRISAMVERMEAEGSISSYFMREMSRYDGKWYIAAARNSPEHDICVSVIKRHLESLGIKCMIYNSSYGPDVIAHYGRERIAVEYETGSKSRESTERMLALRMKQYARILMIINDSKIDQYNALENVRLIRLGDFLNSQGFSGLLDLS